ncbi:hypothetical protein FNV43_RR02735 [Rhamnella rubrinervis]|uniref:Uncharacterized protein n=1 Tax=Rhamnella rubrinervis TaxID=2594499 RepID=A0A8K0MN83_9ROSA|nr:hypothetical protein FNV43_RR02735 [Rhamnella rubrinervis]
MSRHRRQASQVLPPELIVGDEPPKTYDLVLDSSSGVHGGSTTPRTNVAETTSNPPAAHQEASPALVKKPPAAGRPT